MNSNSDIDEYVQYLKGLDDRGLMGVLEHVNKDAVPGRYEAVVSECKRRGLIGQEVTEEQVEEWRSDQPDRNPSRYFRKIIIGIILIVLVKPAIVKVKQYFGDRELNFVKSKYHEQLTTLPSYENEKDFLEKAFESSFDQARSEFVQRWSDRSDEPTVKDAHLWHRDLYNGMIRAARREGKNELVKELGFFKIVYSIDPNEKDPDVFLLHEQ